MMIFLMATFPIKLNGGALLIAKNEQSFSPEVGNLRPHEFYVRCS